MDNIVINDVICLCQPAKAAGVCYPEIRTGQRRDRRYAFYAGDSALPLVSNPIPIDEDIELLITEADRAFDRALHAVIHWMTRSGSRRL